MKIGEDFFSELPSGGDVYLLKSVLHNWPAPDAARILQCCRRAVAPSARLLLAGRMVPADAKPSEASWSTSTCSRWLEGERTEAE